MYRVWAGVIQRLHRDEKLMMGGRRKHGRIKRAE
jgi:hypothetical protein